MNRIVCILSVLAFAFAVSAPAATAIAQGPAISSECRAAILQFRDATAASSSSDPAAFIERVNREVMAPCGWSTIGPPQDDSNPLPVIEIPIDAGGKVDKLVG